MSERDDTTGGSGPQSPGPHPKLRELDILEG
jgi:hypothetical protein